MAREWTAEQRLAIDTRDKSLLVSAAAGSGKTATLTQRIIESILDEEDPADIDKMLIATFTRAAVAELRERIGAAIKERLSAEPENSRLERQLMLLPSAKIITIDAFCNDCLKSFPEAAGINPVYRIADEAEILLISREIFDGITEAILRGELSDIISKEEFEALTDCLSTSRMMSDTFDIFRKMHTKLGATLHGIESLAPLAEEYSPSKFTVPEDTAFGRYIMERQREEFEFRARLFFEFAKRLSADEKTVGNYAQIAENEAQVYTRVANSASYAEMRERISGLDFLTLSTPRNAEKTVLMQKFADMRSKEKALISEAAEKFFSYSEEQWRDVFEIIYPLLQSFLKVLRIYDRALTDKKKQLSTFDYTDIERFALSVLVKDGEPTEIAKSLSEEYRYIYIDEYQDVNDLQDMIFRAISKENNRFTVGDIKQSIYGFRSANPEIFANAKRSYPKIESAKDSPAASLFMSKNFRSSRGIVDFVNSVFDKMFGILGKSIDYDPSDKLTSGRAPLGDGYTAMPQICICKEEELSTEDSEGSESVCAIVTAAKIDEILHTGRREDGSAVRPSDIAVILRSLKSKSEKYVAAIEALGIPVKTSGKKSFFMNADVLLALCLLNSINNPLRDVYLTGLLRSPLFDFTADELVMIRGEERHKPFYRSLCDFVNAHPEFEKGRVFLASLTRWRETAEGVKTDKLLASLFRETGLLALAAEHGEKDNLIRLYEYARSFEGSSFGGLGSFISYINNVIAEGGKFDCNISESESDAVTVISAHSSKGLEFPIVILADCEKPIKNRDTSEKLLYSQGFGVGIRHRSEDGLSVIDNPMINAVAQRMIDVNFEEELRVLYVALTRAKERLFIIGSTKLEGINSFSEKLEWTKFLLDCPAAARRLGSYLDIICATSGCTPVCERDFLSGIEAHGVANAESNAAEPPKDGRVSTENFNTGGGIFEKSEFSDGDAQELKELFSERFNYKYHSPHLGALPEKMSISALYPTVLDGTEEEVLSIAAEAKKCVPEFIKPSKAEESKRRGIATHLFLQFCDFERLDAHGAQDELERLVKADFISEEDAPRVRISEINGFLRSELFGRIKSAKGVLREFRFNTHLPAAIFTQDEEKAGAYKDRLILVQGVIDCIIEEADGSLSIVDYKTDRLTKEELENQALAEEKLRSAHEDQLCYYCLAAEKIFGKKPKRAEVFSLHLGRCVDVMKK